MNKMIYILYNNSIKIFIKLFGKFHRTEPIRLDQTIDSNKRILIFSNKIL